MIELKPEGLVHNDGLNEYGIYEGNIRTGGIYVYPFMGYTSVHLPSGDLAQRFETTDLEALRVIIAVQLQLGAV